VFRLYLCNERIGNTEKGAPTGIIISSVFGFGVGGQPRTYTGRCRPDSKARTFVSSSSPFTGVQVMRRNRGFTLIELLVVISIIALLIGILLPALGAARRTARQMQNSTQVRGIHQGHVLYSQGNGTYYAGLTSTGVVAGAVTGAANIYGGYANDVVGIGMAQLLNGNYFTPAYLINPAETNTNIATYAAVAGSSVGSIRSSYASLSATSATTDATRRAEFRDNTNTQAAILGDRVTNQATEAGGTVAVASQRSVWTSVDADWRGSTVFGDNSTVFLTTALLSVSKYGTVTNTGNDNLFIATDGSDTAANGFFIRSGN